MKIHASDSKPQQAKVVYNGSTTYATVAARPSCAIPYACQCKDRNCDLTKSFHPKVTPTHRQTRCWTCGLAACCIFAIVAAVGLFVLLYSAANPVKDKYVGECEVDILPDERQCSGYKEHMTADKETNLETFDVPEINDNHPATILHDFFNEITVYLDRAEGICFVMTLNTTQVVPPKSLLEIFIRYKRGDFSLKMDTIRETMHVQTPPISDISSFGLGATVLCEDLPAYWLVKSGTPSLRKRSISSDEHHVTYFNGLHIMELTFTYGSI